MMDLNAKIMIMSLIGSAVSQYSKPSSPSYMGKYYGYYSSGSTASWPTRKPAVGSTVYSTSPETLNITNILPKLDGTADIVGLVMNMSVVSQVLSSYQPSISYCDSKLGRKAYTKLGCLWSLLWRCPYSEGDASGCPTSYYQYMELNTENAIRSVLSAQPYYTTDSKTNQLLGNLLKKQAANIAQTGKSPFVSDADFFAYMVLLSPNIGWSVDSTASLQMIYMHQAFVSVSAMSPTQLDAFLKAGKAAAGLVVKRAEIPPVTMTTAELLAMCPLNTIAKNNALIAGCLSGLVNYCFTPGNSLAQCRSYYETVYTNSIYAPVMPCMPWRNGIASLNCASGIDQVCKAYPADTGVCGFAQYSKTNLFSNPSFCPQS
jgi:hypothetical protein